MKQADEQEKNKPWTENQTISHLIIIGIYTVFSTLLIVTTILQPWEKWTIPLILLSIIIVWAVYIGQVLTEEQQVSLYTGLMLLEFFAYGAHEGTFFDLPVIMCLLIMVLLFFRKMLLIYIAACTYGIEVLYHVCFLDTFKDANGLSVTRVFLDIAAVISCVLLSKFLLEKRQLEKKQTDKALMMLKTTNHRSEDFLSNVSHELRTPINAVTGISDILLQKELPPDLRKNMVSIQQAGRRLAIEINNILDYTDLTAGRQSISNEDYLASSSFNDMIVMAVTQNEVKNLELVFDVDADIPSVLIGDEIKIRRVMNILLENAIKFTETGGIYIHIGYRKADYGINLNIQIQDTGIGMNAAQLSQIYYQFYQADSGSDRRASGLGLGLPIAHGLIHAMGGFMNILSEPENGTQVQISIPQGVGDESPCMVLYNQDALNVICYFGLEPYSGEVREYYKRMLKNFEAKLGLTIHIVHQAEEFQDRFHAVRPTHVFITQDIYVANPDYYEEMGKSIFVTIIAENEFELPLGNSSLFLLHKPFYVFPMVNILNESKYRTNSDHSIILSEEISCKGIKVLVVDDDQMNLLVAKGIFSNYGMEVDTCLGGEAALEQCLLINYDAIFLDHMMPGMDGVETLKRIRALESGFYQNIPIVALTANAVNGAREMFKNEGFDEFVAKPIERSVLERVLRRILPGKCKRTRVSKIRQMSSLQDNSTKKPAIQDTSAAPNIQEVQNKSSESIIQDVPEEPALPITSTAASPLALLAKQGFDINTGISYCADSEEFYLEMLQNFHASSASKQAEIAACHKTRNWENYTISVHALKSSSRTIGANELSACAAGLEQAGKNQDIPYIEENHPKLIGLYQTCCTQIRNCIDMSVKEPIINASAEVPEETWQTALNDLSAALNSFNSFQAESVIKELSGYVRHGQSCSKLFQPLAAYLDDFDFEKAGDELCRLSEEGIL